MGAFGTDEREKFKNARHPLKAYEDYGLKMGVKHMYSGPFVRSSYNAHLFAG